MGHKNVKYVYVWMINDPRSKPEDTITCLSLSPLYTACSPILSSLLIDVFVQMVLQYLASLTIVVHYLICNLYFACFWTFGKT